MEPFLDKINEYSAVSINLASPEEIRSWSHGEVKKPETINYRTYRPEKGGLFCEKIFGPEKDWQCSCGKHKGMKYKGVVCDRCGVEVTHSRVRRYRMGHINLAAPVAHIWFFKSIPSRMGTLLDMKTSALERIIYYQDYVVVDAGDTDLEEKALLSEEQYRELKEKYGDRFHAEMGASALKKLLMKVDLEALSRELRNALKSLPSSSEDDILDMESAQEDEDALAESDRSEDTRKSGSRTKEIKGRDSKAPSKQRAREYIKRLRIVEMFLNSGNRAEWMILEVVPVIPPDLRPLVLLDNGTFATSDLNDLYRRLINRNNRLRKLIELNAPEIIIRNEKRMLQQSVDALFDNGRCRRPVIGTGNRLLKSITDMIKGKQGRFRENLLGKRVDYSARSVIVVGPTLKLDQCGLPKKIALELYQPFIIRKLKQMGLADTIKSARRMLEKQDERVWDILEEVVKNHPVLLNRAPTLHRMGIQAFYPVLIEGKSIEIHPLVCAAFNADFDGDQMAVHLPLSWEAQTEAKTLMLSTHNVFSPAHGGPIIGPTQDTVLGCSYLTIERPGLKGEGKVFASPKDILVAYDHSKVDLHAVVKTKLPEHSLITTKHGQRKYDGGFIETTPGRALFNSKLPPGMPYYNIELGKKDLSQIVDECYRRCGIQSTITLLDEIKDLGFLMATVAGLSICKDDMRVPAIKKRIIAEAEKQIEKIEKNYKAGVITDGERYNQVIDCWTHVREQLGQELLNELKNDVRWNKPYLNPIYIMAHSGARGSVDQVRQLAGMRGLMAKPSGKIIETPIKACFREGLSVLEYFSSTHGARKGLADTALKTADAGYLTRKLADVAQNVIITMEDCGTLKGITKSVIFKGEHIDVPLRTSIIGRVARDNIVDVVTDEVVVRENEMITEAIASRIEDLGYEKLRVRSPLTCEAPYGICSKCYGMDLSRGAPVELGTAVGIIAAQSIGEPGTQLTMRTFHIGGTAHRTVEASEIRAQFGGTVRFENVKKVETKDGEVVLNRNGVVIILDEKRREIERHELPLGSYINVKEGQKVVPRKILAHWDPHNIPIRTEKAGYVHFEGIIENETMRREIDPRSGVHRKVIIEHKGEHIPQILIKDRDKTTLAAYPIPEKAHIEVEDGMFVEAGTLLAKTPKEIIGTQDITGGLPRVTELFEARKPKDQAVMSEIDGIVEFGETKRGKRTIRIINDKLVHTIVEEVLRQNFAVDVDLPAEEIKSVILTSGQEGMQTYIRQKCHSLARKTATRWSEKRIGELTNFIMDRIRRETISERLVPQGKHLRVHRGDSVRAGDPLVEGPLVLQDILEIKGIEAVQDYLLREIQGVYRTQNVSINDKHIEVIISQMLRRVKIEDPGDTSFLPSAVVDRTRFHTENRKMEKEGKRPATAKPLLLGITKAALHSDSFMSAASFQETTRVLSEAAIQGKVDHLQGLKENVILGRLIPAGTGFQSYSDTIVKQFGEPLEIVPGFESVEIEKDEEEAAEEVA